MEPTEAGAHLPEGGLEPDGRGASVGRAGPGRDWSARVSRLLVLIMLAGVGAVTALSLAFGSVQGWQLAALLIATLLGILALAVDAAVPSPARAAALPWPRFDEVFFGTMPGGAEQGGSEQSANRSRRPERRSRYLGGRRGFWLLPVQGALAFIPPALYPSHWSAAPAMFTTSLLLTFPLAWAAPCSSAVLVAYAVVCERGGMHLYGCVFTIVASVLTSVALFGMARQVELTEQLERTQVELARQAVAHQRIRFAHDLHDLLGYRLTAISLKLRIAVKHLPTSAPAAQRELAEAVEIVLRAMADVRDVSHGYRRSGLRTELAAAQTLLESIGIAVLVEVDLALLDTTTEAVLGLVLQEGLANLLRHSTASRCEIVLRSTVQAAAFRLSNDGAPCNVRPRVPPADGIGLPGLIERVELLGGCLSATLSSDGWFHLTARVPLTASPGRRPTGA